MRSVVVGGMGSVVGRICVKIVLSLEYCVVIPFTLIEQISRD